MAPTQPQTQTGRQAGMSAASQPGINTALIVEGGAMRGIFSCGVLDRFIEQDFFPFDLCLGVSAGASNAAAYLARMPGRNYRVYTDYSLRPEFISTWRALRGGHLMDLDWMWDVTRRELPLDHDTLFSQPTDLLITATCCDTGEAHYLRPTPDNLFEVLKASSALPVAYRAVIQLFNRRWSDGGVSDSIPVQEAYRRGARRIMVLRSQPRDYQMSHSGSDKLMSLLLRSDPALRQTYLQRPQSYNQTLAYMRQPPSDCEIIEICPPDDFAVSRTTQDKQLLDRAYHQGKQQALKAISAWESLQELPG